MSYTIKDHVENVVHFMNEANQITSEVVRVPTSREAELRAKLIFEECLETIGGLGVSITLMKGGCEYNLEHFDSFEFAQVGHFSPKEVLDGICDVYVVSTGTLACCGLTPVFETALSRVDENNLSKVDGHHSFREDGKLLKSPYYKPVELDDLLQ